MIDILQSAAVAKIHLQVCLKILERGWSATQPRSYFKPTLNDPGRREARPRILCAIKIKPRHGSVYCADFDAM